ncbi:MAG: type II toxin-antitoxin system mRNA interferase toxin, RelE/StbE family [Candidatus Shapirobacteria bacterium]|nr:type II toxin-antitoxin system mRNA interferase toxin, RelE/StbE family [Candidatus Shapirobacteria bacterium]
MKVVYSARFSKKLGEISKKNRELAKDIADVVQALIDNPKDKGLRVHKLRDDLGDYYSASVTESIRIVFYNKENFLVLVNLGTHEDVYKEN